MSLKLDVERYKIFQLTSSFFSDNANKLRGSPIRRDTTKLDIYD